MIEYRRPVASDIPQMADLYAEAGFAERDGAAGFIAKTFNTCHWLVAVEGGRLAGMARAICDHASDCFIQDVAVKKEFRRRGVASGLVTRLVELVRAEGVDWIGLVSVPGAENLYRKCGFTPLEGYTAMRAEQPRESVAGEVAHPVETVDLP